MVIIVSCLFVLLILQRVNSLRNKTAYLKMELKLHGLRQDLMKRYIEGKIKADRDIVYSFNNLLIDSSSSAKYLSLWVIWYTTRRKLYNPNPNVDVYVDKLKECPEMKVIFYQYTNAITQYLLDKSVFSLLGFQFFTLLSKISSKCKKWVLEYKKNIREQVIQYEEKAWLGGLATAG